MRFIHIIIFITLLLPNAYAEEKHKYWIAFTDKDSTHFSLSQPNEYLSQKALDRRQTQGIAIDSTDLPVCEQYINAVLAKGAELHSVSKWMNGITISLLDSTIIDSIKTLPQVKFIQQTYTSNLFRSSKMERTVFPEKRVATVSSGYGNAYEQINMVQGDWLHQAGYKGEGMTIGVVDAGFKNANSIVAYSRAWSNNQILGTRDFVNPGGDVFGEHYHGSHVLSVMAAYQQDVFIGTAPDASYWLIRAEDSKSENLIESDNLVAAMEFLDSVGVDIITASLGYTEFDDSRMNFNKTTDLNGKTARASRAATMCIRKGMIYINSAGNLGDKPWKYISIPSDADSIFTIGAVNDQLEKSVFSSIGPSSDGRIKPTLAALGTSTNIINEEGLPSTNNGTSFSTPIISGLTACLWQAFPEMSNVEIMELIKKHASLYETPNNEIGYGIPDFYAAYLDASSLTGKPIESKDRIGLFPNPIHDTVTIEFSSLEEYPKLVVAILRNDGKRVFREQMNANKATFSLSHLPAGVYTFVLYKNNQAIFRQKVIKE